MANPSNPNQQQPPQQGGLQNDPNKKPQQQGQQGGQGGQQGARPEEDNPRKPGQDQMPRK